MPYLATDLAASSAGPQAKPDRPIVLTRLSGSATVVAHACPRAQAARIYPGMSLAEARAILPEALTLPHEPRDDETTLEHLALWAQRFSPIVESVLPDVLLLDVTGCERLFRGEENIVRQAMAGLAERRIRARAAIADRVGAAWALAHAAPEPAVVAPTGQTVPHLVGLPPAALRLDEKTAAVLDDLGIRTIGDLLMLPRSTLPSRFGEELVLRLRQILGEVPEPIDPFRQAPVFSAGMPFGPTDRLEVVMAALERMVAALCERLVAGEVTARRLLCVVYFEGRPPASFWVGLSRPSREARHLRALLVPQVERVDLSAPAVGLRVTAIETANWRPVQGGLFEERQYQDEEALGVLIDRLVNRLGHRSVVRAELVDDHQPEKAFRYVPLVEATGRRSDETTKQGNDPGKTDRTRDLENRPVGERPLRVLARPHPDRAMALVPDGPPTWFYYRGREYVVEEAAGPERLETGWWRGADVRRDYFRVLTEGGQQFWLLRDLKTRQWFLHGIYE